MNTFRTLDGNILHPDFHRDWANPMPVEYATECTALDLTHLDITAPVGAKLLLEFFTVDSLDKNIVYPLTTGNHEADNELFARRATVHTNQWQAENRERAKQENLPVTTVVSDAPDYVPECPWEKGAQLVVIMLDGVKIDSHMMFPGMGENVDGLLSSWGYAV